jgi:hypothetical protein
MDSQISQEEKQKLIPRTGSIPKTNTKKEQQATI